MQLRPLVYVLSMAVLALQWQSCVVMTDTSWPVKLNVFTIWPFKFTDPCSEVK